MNSFVSRIKEIYNVVKNKAKDIDEIEVYMSESGEECFSVRERD